MLQKARDQVHLLAQQVSSSFEPIVVYDAPTQLSNKLPALREATYLITLA